MRVSPGGMSEAELQDSLQDLWRISRFINLTILSFQPALLPLRAPLSALLLLVFIALPASLYSE